MSDPKNLQGAEKIPFAALPWAVIAEAALGMGEGAIKYGPHNWRSSAGVEAMTYIAAAQRHLIAYILGEDIDPDSSLPHITKAISSLMVLRDAQINGGCLDNRPPAVPDGFIDGLNAGWGEIRSCALSNQQHNASACSPENNALASHSLNDGCHKSKKNEG